MPRESSADGGKQVAVVTGAASGIGRATAARFARSGCAVLAVDRDADKLAATVADLVAAGGAATAQVVELSDPSAAGDIVEAALSRWGRLDVLALVAGIGQSGPADAISVHEWDRVLDVNLRAPFLLAQAALPHLVRSKGSIVAVTSIAGLQGWPYAAAYAASKGGLVTLMRTLAIEYGPAGVRVNLVAPGSVDTGLRSAMHVDTQAFDESLRKRIGGLDGHIAEPDEIASIIEFLASPGARFISGAVVRADGGAFA